MNKTMNLLAAALLAGGIAFAADTGVPKTYPLTKCPISDEKLGDHGTPVKVTHDGTDVYLCCKSCKKDFEKDAAKFTKMVKDAAAKPAK
jgi:YHS domain-containing protein